MPLVPTVPLFGSSGPIPIEKLQELADALTFALRPPIAELKQAVAQNLTNSTWTAATFDAFDVDTDVDGEGGHSTSVNTSRFTARYPGWYRLTGGPAFFVNGTGIRGSRWTKNGSPVDSAATLEAPITADNSLYAARGKLVYLAIGDYIELQLFQSSGGVLSTAAPGGALWEACNASITWESIG